MRWVGKLIVRKMGEYVFDLGSDNAAQLWIDDELVCDTADVGEAAAAAPAAAVEGEPAEGAEAVEGEEGLEIE